MAQIDVVVIEVIFLGLCLSSGKKIKCDKMIKVYVHFSPSLNSSRGGGCNKAHYNIKKALDGNRTYN
jgi:hypothetical protein